MDFKSSLVAPSNSDKSKREAAQETPKEKLTPVASGKREKKSLSRRFSEAFIASTGPEIRSYLFSEVLIPAAKDTISDMVRNGLDMLLYGSTRPRSGSGKSSLGSKVSYAKYYDDSKKAVRNAVNTRYTYDDVSFDTRPQAEEVLSKMIEVINTYDKVTVSDFYDIATEDGSGSDASPAMGSFQDCKWCWRNLSTASVYRHAGRYYISLPKVEEV